MTSQRQASYQRRLAGRGYLAYYVVAVLIWGAEAVLTKAFLLDVLTPGAMLLLRSAITALVLSPLILLDRPPLRRLIPRDWAALLALSLLGTALPTLLYFAALDVIQASTTMLLYRTEPIFVILLSVVVLRQRIAPRVWLLTLVAVACAYLIAGAPTPPLTSTTLATATASDSLALPTRRASIQAPAAGAPTPAAPGRALAVATAATSPSASARPTSGSPAGAAAGNPTLPAVSLARSSNVTPPALLSPGLEARLRGVVQFNWHPTSALPAGAYYEMVVWSPEQHPDQAWGVAPPRITTSLTLNLDELFRSGRFREGSLYWTVLVVEQNPYRRLTLPSESERRYLVLATDG